MFKTNYNNHNNNNNILFLKKNYRSHKHVNNNLTYIVNKIRFYNVKRKTVRLT